MVAREAMRRLDRRNSRASPASVRLPPRVVVPLAESSVDHLSLAARDPALCGAAKPARATPVPRRHRAFDLRLPSDAHVWPDRAHEFDRGRAFDRRRVRRLVMRLPRAQRYDRSFDQGSHAFNNIAVGHRYADHWTSWGRRRWREEGRLAFEETDEPVEVGSFYSALSTAARDPVSMPSGCRCNMRGDAGVTIPDWKVHNLQCFHYTSVATGRERMLSCHILTDYNPALFRASSKSGRTIGAAGWNSPTSRNICHVSTAPR